MLNVLSTLFDSNETYLSKHVAGINRTQAFPARNRVNFDEFIHNTFNDSIIVSGGSDEERSVLLLGLTRSSQGCVVIIHNGNRYITAERLVAFEKPVIFQVKAAQETVRFLSDCNLELFMYDYNNFSSNKLFNQAERESIEWLNENLESSHNHIKLFIEPEMDISSINGIRDLITLRCKELAKAVVDVVKR